MTQYRSIATWDFSGRVGIESSPWAGDDGGHGEVWHVSATLPELHGAPEFTIHAHVSVEPISDANLFAELGCHTIAVGTDIELVTWEQGSIQFGSDTFVINEQHNVRASLHRPDVVATSPITHVTPVLASHLLGCAAWSILAGVTGEMSRLVPVRCVPQFAAEITQLDQMFHFTGNVCDASAEISWSGLGHVH